MTEAKYTPGTWCVSNGKLLRVSAAVSGVPGRAICICGVHRIGDKGGMALGDPLANARLIAAAPDLLEALIDAVAVLEALNIEGPKMDEARAAIAKAKGETP